MSSTGLIVRENQKNFTPAPEGLWPAVCVDIVDLGLQQTNYGEKHKVRISWQINQRNKENRRFLVAQRFTFSLHEKSKLRRNVESWRGGTAAD